MVALASLLSSLPIKPGDVIAFSGNGLVGKAIRRSTRSPYSHVGIVLDNLGGRYRLAESSFFNGLPDFQQQPAIKGVQLHWLEDWLSAYRQDGAAFWVPLKNEITRPQLPVFQQTLLQQYSSRATFSYRKMLTAWLKQYRLSLPLSKDPKQVYCAEMVAIALQNARILPPSLIPQHQTPATIIELPCFASPTILYS
ncbi:MAG: hypothetical protein AAGE59_34800 [Cyanobacteria bacterium P01_F01_bin.86]